MVTCAFNLSTRKAEVVDLFEFEASLVCRASSMIACAVTQRNPVKNKREKERGGGEKENIIA